MRGHDHGYKYLQGDEKELVSDRTKSNSSGLWEEKFEKVVFNSENNWIGKKWSRCSTDWNAELDPMDSDTQLPLNFLAALGKPCENSSHSWDLGHWKPKRESKEQMVRDLGEEELPGRSFTRKNLLGYLWNEPGVSALSSLLLPCLREHWLVPPANRASGQWGDAAASQLWLSCETSVAHRPVLVTLCEGVCYPLMASQVPQPGTTWV